MDEFEDDLSLEVEDDDVGNDDCEINDDVDDEEPEDVEEDDDDLDEGYKTEQEISIDELLSDVDEREEIDLSEPLLQGCCSYLAADTQDALTVSPSVICSYTTKKFPEALECLICEINQFCNVAMAILDKSNDSERTAILDHFLRYRHEVLSDCLLETLKLNKKHTDIAFCEVLPITSKRTPDFIELLGDKKVLIIEVSAVSDVERGARAKGDSKKGFESKYEREIKELRLIGYEVNYVVMLFDVKDEFNRDHFMNINEVMHMLDKEFEIALLHKLEFIRKEFCNATRLMNDNYGKYYKYLFSEPYSIKNPSNFSSLYIYGEPTAKFDEDYKSYPISNYMYESTTRLIIRLPMLLDLARRNKKLRDSKMILVLDCRTDKFEFIKDKNGSYIDDWENALDKNSRLWMCKNMKVVDNGVEVKQRADFEYFDLKQKSFSSTRRPLSNLRLSFEKHPSSIHYKDEVILKSYDNVIKSQEYAEKLSIYEDKYYEAELLDKMTRFNTMNPLDANINTKVKPFCDSVVGNEMFEESLRLYDLKMENLNSKVSDTGKVWVKSPFIYPLYSPTIDHLIPVSEKPSLLLNEMKNWRLGPYTSKIIFGITSTNFQFGTHSIPVEGDLAKYRKELGDYTREVNAKLKRLNEKNLGIKKSKIDDLDDGHEIKKKLQLLNNNVREESKKMGLTEKKIGIYTFSNKKKSQSMFKDEMLHFKSKSTPSFYKGIGLNFNEDLVNNQIGELFSVLLGPSPITSEWDIFDENVYKDSKLLMDLKSKALKEVQPFHNYLRNLNLYSSCEFISKFCHSLLYHSQTTANNTMVAVDNLGYRNVLLLVKGGKKIFGTKRSKLFRLFYPTYDSCASLYEHMGHKGSFEIREFDGSKYMCTPWMNFHETVLTDGLTICHRLMGFMLINRNPTMTDDENVNRVFFNVILALHNRRQTEMLMHNLRYVFMNCMSNFSSVDQILPELAGFNYDLFQVWLRCKLRRNFCNFANEMKSIHDRSERGKLKQILLKSNLRHPFLEFSINDLETLALSVYSTYLMSKAPTTQTLEQISNLKGMCETHEEFLENVGKTSNATVTIDDLGVESYYNSLFESDFNYDPKYCVLLGKFFSDYLNQITVEKNIHLKWEQILEGCWNSLANTKGLRYKGKDFFGSKGYYVVNKCLLEEEEGYKKVNKLLDLIESDITMSEKTKKLKEFNQTFRNRIANKSLESAVFHVVDKKQRGGKREIFVMDLETKVHQQVIEKYMAYLCKLTPNEMISIPSNRRLQTIHSRVFEAGGIGEDQCFMVLDCRKWAPKSMIDKFLLFLTGMSGFLPSSFIYHCQNFFHLLMDKKIYTRKHIFENFEKNDSLKKYTKFFVEDASNGGYFYKPEYSWVMGIFNYFSSLFHVACQMHIAHLLRVNFSSNYNSECTLHMVAHSDDSAGRIICDSLPLIRRGLFYYELFMHSANHLISKKKSNVGRTYYEFISILYIGGELLSLLAKFSGIFNFHPSDKGYCTDITDAYSKCLELVLNGASLNQAYIAMKIQADLIYKFYFNSKQTASGYELPPAMFGSIDAHPLMVMLCGSDADVVRLFHSLTEEEINVIIAINECLLPADSSGEGLFKQFKTNPNVRLNPKLKEMKDKHPIRDLIKDSWSLKNVKFNNTTLDLAQFLIKLEDKNFIAALQDETVVRRISRSYFYRSGLSIDTRFGPMKMKDIKELCFLLKSSLKNDVYDFDENLRQILCKVKEEILEQIAEPKSLMKNMFSLVYNEAICLNLHLEKFSLKEENIINVKKTCKPVHFNVQSTIEPCPTDFEPSSLVSWIKEPELRFLLPEVKGLMTAQNYLLKVLDKFEMSFDELPPETIFTLARKISKKSKVEFFCYSNLPAGIREISTYQDIMLFLAHNSNSNEYIKGLDVQYGKTISTSSWVMLPDFENPSLQWTMSFYLILITILKQTRDDLKIILNITVNPPDFLNNEEKDVTLFMLFSLTKSFWRGRYKHERYLMPYMHQIECLMNGKIELDPDMICDTYYHTFLKRQFLVDNLWLGKGRLFVSCGIFKIVFNLLNVKISHVTVRDVDHVFNNDEIAYMNFCLHNSQLPSINSSMRFIGVEDWDKLMMGINEQGTYYIGKGRDMISGIDVDFNLNLETSLSQMNLGSCRIGGKGKVVWTRLENERTLKYQLNFVPLSPQNSMDLLKGLIINDRHNNRQLTKFNSTPSKFLLDMCVEELEIEVGVKLDQMLISPSSTMTYKILKHCNRLQLCKVSVDEVKYSHYPAQDGGLLRALIEYSKVKQDFDFRWEHHVSPEYMSLKSTQPEAFTTELFDNIKKSYDQLFTKMDKQMIIKALSSMTVGGNFTEEQVMKVASEWGFIGIQGALDSMMGEKRKENFKGVRNHSHGALRAYYSKIFFEFCELLYKILGLLMLKYKKGFETTPVNWTNISPSNYKNHFISLIHQIHIGCYSSTPKRSCCLRLAEILAHTIIKRALEDKEVQKEFREGVDKIANFRTLPCREIDVQDWYTLWNTLLKNFEGESHFSESIDCISVIDRKINITYPTTLTKDFCNKLGLKFELKRTYHSGVISSALFTRYTNEFKTNFENSTLVIRFKVVKDANIDWRSVPMSPFIFPRHPFSKAFMDSDEYEDVLMELQSTDFDAEAYEEVIESFEDGPIYEVTPIKRLKLSERGRLNDSYVVDFKLFMLFGGNYTLNNLSYLRQSGDNIILVTDCLDMQMNLMANPPLIFRNIDDRWHNQSLVNPMSIFLYIFSHNYKDVNLWERTLGLKLVSQGELMSLKQTDLLSYMSGAGVKTGNFEKGVSNTGEEFYQTTNKLIEEKEECSKDDEFENLKGANDEGSSTDSLDETKEIEEIFRRRLIESGMDLEASEKYMNMFKEEKNRINKEKGSLNDKAYFKDLLSYFKHSFEGLDNKEKDILKVKNAFTKILRKDLTSEQRELIFQVPLIFGGNRSKRKGFNNKTLRNPYFLSEIEAVCPGLIWDLLSGSLGISPTSRKRWNNQFKILNMASKDLKNNPKGKKFYLNLIKLILNDAKPTKENDRDDDRWSKLIHEVTDIFIKGEGAESDEENLFDDPEGIGRLDYEVAGMSNI